MGEVFVSAPQSTLTAPNSSPHPLIPSSPPPSQADVYSLVRDRYLLFVQCLEAKPGQEPKHPYLYPQAAVAAAHHH